MEQPVQRSYTRATLDYLGAHYVGAGPETCSYTTQGIQIPMRDGIELAGDFYAPDLPDNQAPAGLILIQCCYGRGAGISFMDARVFAARGFQALLVSTRGTYGSDGIFDPGSNEQSDSQDIVVWMRQQPWYPGSFATLGPSYLGYSQWALLHDPPADCVAAVIPVGPHDHAWHAWGTGSFRLDRASWSDMMSRTDDQRGRLLLSRLSSIPGLGFLRSSELDEAVAGLPLDASLQKYFGDKAPWLFEYLKHPNVDDVYWTPRRHQIALERVKIPILLISGWYDTFTTQTMHQFKHLHGRGVNVRLVVGPWTHVQASGLHSIPEIMDFLAEHLAKTVKYNRFPAHIFITGAQEWRSMPTWPPATRPAVFYLQENSCLGSKQPTQDANPASFVFDPRSPTPSIGGNQMSVGGRVDDSAYANQSDVLTFTSEPLSEDLEVLGVPSVHLIHASDPPFADLFVRLSEVDAQGVSHNITDVYKALDPMREMSHPIRLDLQDCAHLFRVGMRVRLIVAGGSFPMYARSLGTAENRVRSDKTAPQKHIISIAGGVSQLTLPVRAAV
ncbi:uncharacterized protein N7482_005213 [Penicillium canariense]|uniref:Xaa-Pro dipeptidyl-peptidase C-terminal domain-containing protein n=1 Tax=Penicillium canariense TaxID=189055 RepID=A0A9W9I663_9EURO|nr:uncharacterized protein N7482_005213 [Penicillium canariense]KAJ5166432.1 hypothetical protein N7482_005213 [Penicillium canariense]